MVSDEARWWLPRDDLERLIEVLRADGRDVMGPTVRDGAIVLEPIEEAAALPWGVTDEQAPGRYRLDASSGDRPAKAFDHASSPMSWKRWLFPPAVPIGRATNDGGRLTFTDVAPEPRPMAFLGVRGCDLAAIAIQDRVLAGGPVADAHYAASRGAALLIGVDCATPSATCFCSSMGTGPEVGPGHDLALTEIDDGFVVRVGSDAGMDVVRRLALAPADEAKVADASRVPGGARAAMTDGVAADGLPGRLLARLDHPRWAEVAERCLACTSCTMVCPTCFCTSVTQRSDLDGSVAGTDRQWDSCFTLGFASVAGGNFRSRRQDRYRQWLTHKFGTWVQQFGTSGCVGCGRCITWCPVGIDVREELAVIAAPPAPRERAGELPAPPVAAGLGRYAIATVVANDAETADTRTLTLGDVPEAIRSGGPGQFLMVDLPGFAAAPISVSRYSPDTIALTIRSAGAATRAITSLPVGAQLGLRGPLGRGWPVAVAEGRDVLIVAGGIGLAPLRPLIDALLGARDRYGDLRLCIGARTPDDLLLRDDVAAWTADPRLIVEVTVDRAGPEWNGPVGVVTTLLDRSPLDPVRTTAFVCGPERMMRTTARTLAGRGLLPDRLYLSTERHMECGIGLCGHCQMGPFFVCRDGPVFSRAELGDALEVEGI
jgi:NAD(P)H-flavin reductase/NAD-dependent dihydropyrimidine dehydrogenase PreA subunit